MHQSIFPHTTKVEWGQKNPNKLGTKLIFNVYSTQPNFSIISRKMLRLAHCNFIL